MELGVGDLTPMVAVNAEFSPISVARVGLLLCFCCEKCEQLE